MSKIQAIDLKPGQIIQVTYDYETIQETILEIEVVDRPGYLLHNTIIVTLTGKIDYYFEPDTEVHVVGQLDDEGLLFLKEKM